MVKKLRAAAIAGVGLLGMIIATPAASAGAGCSLAGCSTTVNDSSHGAFAFRNWCWGGNSTGDTKDHLPDCKSGNVAQEGRYLYSHGGRTPGGQDWDVLRVDAGWCYRVRFVRSLAPDFTQLYDRRGKGAIYVKVGDEAIARINLQSTSSCP